MDFKRAFGKKKHKSGFRRVLKQLKSIDFTGCQWKIVLFSYIKCARNVSISPMWIYRMSEIDAIWFCTQSFKYREDYL